MLWGIDLGGTKIEGVILDAGNHKILLRERIATQQEKGYVHILNRIKLLIENMATKLNAKPNQLGIGTPGSIDTQTQLLKNSNTVKLNHRPFLKDITDLLGLPVTIANDANCFALAETKMGIVAKAYPKAKVIFGVIMGTGVGGGIVVNGKIINGLNGIGGEWGHNFLDESGGKCYCGQIGCVECIISGTALERFYNEQSKNQLSLKQIVENYKKGKDIIAQRTIERLHHFFGKALSQVINILDPDAIILGGGVGNIETLYTQGKITLYQYVFNPQCNTPLIKPALGDSAGVLGAALLNQ